MTTRLKIGLTAAAGAAALMAGGATLSAQTGGLRGPMKHFDADSNGAVTLAEARSGIAAMIAGADTDKDGRVTHEEMRAFHGRMGGHHGGKHGAKHGGDHKGPHADGSGKPGGPMHLDSDGDGALTLAEAQAGIDSHFARIDSNRDGSITEAEFRAAHEAHRR